MASTPNIKTTDFAAPDTWRARLLAGQKTLIDAFFAKPDTYTSQFLRERSRLVDDLLKAIWHSQNLPPDWSLIAVGGYGRGELFPASDIDILIFLPHPPQAGETEQLNHLIGLFWDAGLEIAHSVRTQNDCLEEAAHDITVQTALLESRLLTGDPARFGVLRQALKDHLDPIAFFKAKRAEQAERHAHFEDTAYSLEPNCKESPGGLRDLQVILWIAQAAGIGNTWQALEAHGLLTHEECIKTEKNEQILGEIRIRLHLIARRREDRLLFDYQNTLAHQFGLSDTAHKRASEAMMHRYYSAAKTVSQLNTILLQNIGVSIFPARARDAVIQPINERFRMHGELLDAIDESIFKQHKPAILEAFWLMQQNPKLKGMTARTLRALWRARLLIDHDFRRAPENRARFLSLFQSEQGVVHEFRRMNQYDILGRYLPVFGHIVGQMQHDLFHVFTVDQHILQVLRNLRRLILPEFMHEYPLASRLIADFDKPWLLYIAALFHDIAKGRGGDHSQLGAKDARRFCIQHGLDPEDRELVVWLVKEHLTFSAVAQKQDISDPQVIASFAAQVGDERRLVALYLLTVADIRGTSPKVWSAWKSRLLDSLYASMHHYFQRDNVPPAHGVIHERQQEALGLLRNFALPDTVHERLWKHLDTAYFLRHEAEEMAWHVQSLHYRTTIDRPVVKARVNPHGTGLQVLVYTRDQRDLFARIVGFFARAGFSIADAKIYTTAHGYALDSFVIFDYRRQDDGPDMTGYIEQELSQRLLNQTPPESPPDIRLSRQVRHLPIAPQVQIESDEHHRYHVMTIVAADRPGLLFSVANTLARHGITLHTAKITTLGERAEDVFLLSGDDLGSSPLRLNLENEILDALKL